MTRGCKVVCVPVHTLASFSVVLSLLSCIWDSCFYSPGVLSPVFDISVPGYVSSSFSLTLQAGIELLLLLLLWFYPQAPSSGYDYYKDCCLRSFPYFCVYTVLLWPCIPFCLKAFWTMCCAHCRHVFAPLVIVTTSLLSCACFEVGVCICLPLFSAWL